MAIAISMTMARDIAAKAWGGALTQGGYGPVGASVQGLAMAQGVTAQGATAWGGGYGAATAQGATGLQKTSGKSYGKLGLRNTGAKECKR